MPILKRPRDNNKVSETKKKLDYPVFCFKHLTNNKTYNIHFFKKEVREKQKAYGALFFLLCDMQSHSWQELFSRPKEKGFEAIPADRLKFAPNGRKLTPDSKVLVIRFKKQQYRLIGIKSEEHEDVFHVLGFDFNHSAYDHGS